MWAHKSDEAKNATIPEQKEAKGPEYVTVAEFNLVDNLRIIAFLAMCVSFSIMGLGKRGMKASWRLNSGMARRIFRRSIMSLVFIFVCSLCIRSYVKDSI